jgi:hypothetical protein
MNSFHRKLDITLRNPWRGLNTPHGSLRVASIAKERAQNEAAAPPHSFVALKKKRHPQSRLNNLERGSLGARGRSGSPWRPLTATRPTTLVRTPKRKLF